MNDGVDLVLAAISDVRADLCELKTEVVAVKKEARETNGRLRKLELWRAGLEAVAASRSWIKPALVAFGSGSAITIIAWTLAHL